MKTGRDAGKKRSGGGGKARKPARAPAPAAGASRKSRPVPGPVKSGAKPAAKASSRSTTKPSTKPVSKPSAWKPSAKPVSKPVTKPSTKPSTKPVTKPTAKPTAKPAPTHSAKPAPSKVPAGKSPAPIVLAKGAARRPVAPPSPIIAAPKIEAPPKFRREYRKWLERLIALRHRLRDEGNRLEEEGLKALEQEVSVDHMADYGSDSYEQDTTLALIENKTEALRDVDDAIKRIELKTYGLCENCEQLVPAGRLEVLPHARYCVKCQAAREGGGT